ncbi:50S ribosomal protein L35, chloroplastic [Linum grandiflorum]
MASLTMLSVNHTLSSLPARVSLGSTRLASFTKSNNSSMKLSFTPSFSSGPLSLSSPKPYSIASLSKRLKSLTVYAAKGYKLKTHKASAKRFRVTGRGKIVRRRAGKQHLLAKKNTKRRLRLSKMTEVDRSDYNNVIGALPYLKVNRLAK